MLESKSALLFILVFLLDFLLKIKKSNIKNFACGGLWGFFCKKRLEFNLLAGGCFSQHDIGSCLAQERENPNTRAVACWRLPADAPYRQVDTTPRPPPIRGSVARQAGTFYWDAFGGGWGLGLMAGMVGFLQ